MFISKQIFHQILAIFPVIFQNFVIGAGCGWVSPTLNKYKDSGGEFSLTDKDCSWIASSHYVGRAIGCLIAAPTVDRIGRVSLFVLTTVSTLVVWIGVAMTKNVLLHYAIRFVFGLTVGIYDTTAPIYVGENSSPNLRGVFGTTICLNFFAGELLTFVAVTYASYMTVAAITLALAFLNLSSTILLREPAQYLIMKGQETKAKNRFAWLRGETEKVNDEFDELKVKLAKLKAEFSTKMFLNPGIRLVIMLNMLIFFNGFPAINTLLTFILVPTSNFTTNQFTILYGATQLVGAGLSGFIIERFGRRSLWMGSTIICTAAPATAAALHYFTDSDQQERPYFAWLIFATMVTYAVTFAALILPLATTARGELLPPQFKAAGVCASILLNSLTGFIVSHMFLIVADAYGTTANYVIYTISGLLLLAYVYFYLPETRGMTLMEIQKLLND